LVKVAVRSLLRQPRVYAFRVAFGFLLCAAITLPAHAVYYNVTILQPAGAYAANAGGTSQVGYGNATVGGPDHALLWSGSAASYVDLNPAGYATSYATGASSTNQVGYGDPPGSNSHALLWSGTAASAVDLNPTSGYDYTKALAVGGGKEVGFGFTNSRLHALLWSGTAASKVDLHPGGSYLDSVATGASDTKQVGYGTLANDNHHAFLWSGTSASRVDLTPSGIADALAYGAWSTKQVGSTCGCTSNFNYHAALWSGTAASKVDLHPTTLPLTYDVSEATAISAAGQVGDAGTTQSASNPFQHAMYWNGTAASAVDLQPFVNNLNPTFVASAATGISDDGIIVGYVGTDTNYSSSYSVMWTPVVESGVPGDYNNDHTVNTADYLVWRKRNGTTFKLMNEVAGITPGQVTAEDYTAWRARFGNITGSGAQLGAKSVPEPSTIALFILLPFALQTQIRADRNPQRKQRN
jgi:hypothetical protein